MPLNLIKSFSKKSGKSVEEIEKIWDKLKKQYGENYEAIVGSLKKILNINEETVSDDIAKDIPPLMNTGKRIMPFKDFIKKNKNQKTDIERVMSYFNLSQFDIDNMSKEELDDLISKLPDRGNGRNGK
jgi:translation initiation factor 2 alpha subunit (eIF-2alpha)